VTHSEWLGAPAQTAVVLLHEGLGSCAQWLRSDIPAHILAQTDYPVFLYDRAGYGASGPRESPWHGGFLTEAAQTELPEVLDEAGINNPILYGHSDGATIALRYAAEQADRVVGLIAEAPHTLVEDCTMEGIRNMLKTYQQTDTRLRQALVRYHGAHTDDLVRGWTDQWLAPAFSDCDLLDILPDITCPILVLQGEHDPYGSMQHADQIRKLCASSVEVCALPCGHAPHREASVTPDLIIRWLNSL
jgi:pimeloyl-ACP methyl ester carboxylesterase